jgi:hypothetical protein
MHEFSRDRHSERENTHQRSCQFFSRCMSCMILFAFSFIDFCRFISRHVSEERC